MRATQQAFQAALDATPMGYLREVRLERVREELDDKEKAINVRRAHKMEKVRPFYFL